MLSLFYFLYRSWTANGRRLVNLYWSLWYGTWPGTLQVLWCKLVSQCNRKIPKYTIVSSKTQLGWFYNLGIEMSLAVYAFVFPVFWFILFFYKWYKQDMVGICPSVNLFSVYPGSTLLTGSSSLQLWSNVDGVKDEAEEGEKQTEMTIRDSHSAWRCIWQSK